MHAPMIPHMAASESPDERAPTLGSTCVPVAVSVVGVVGVSKNNKKMNQEGIKVDLILTVT